MGDVSISNGLLCYILLYLWNSPQAGDPDSMCVSGGNMLLATKLHRFKVINLDMVLDLSFFCQTWYS